MHHKHTLKVDINTHILSWHQALCEGYPFLLRQWCVSPTPAKTLQLWTCGTGWKEKFVVVQITLNDTCSSRWYLRTLCIGTMSKSLRENLPLLALFEHSCEKKIIFQDHCMVHSACLPVYIQAKYNNETKMWYGRAIPQNLVSILYN